MSISSVIHLRQSFSPIARILAAVAGSAIVAITISELWSGIWPPGWHSLFVAPILIGGVTIGSLLLLAAIVGEQTSWVVSDAGITVWRRTILGKRREVVSHRDLVSVDLHENEWDSRPTSFGIVLRTSSGKRLVSPDCASKTEAETLRDRLRTNLGRTP